jgi:hypothetical protein
MSLLNTLAYYGKEIVTAVKSFTVQPGGNPIKLFKAVIYEFTNFRNRNKLECLSLARLSSFAGEARSLTCKH